MSQANSHTGRQELTGEPSITQVLRTPPPMYAVLRAGSTAPEPLRANSDEEAMETVQRQVRAGKTPVVYLYKLLCAELYEPSSVTIPREQVEQGAVSERLFRTPTTNTESEEGQNYK